jgi:cardiolipin synthase A/B
MQRQYLCAIMALVLLSGSRHGEASPDAAANNGNSSAPNMPATTERPQLPRGVYAPNSTDPFGLPLVITMTLPEAPKEIQERAAPIESIKKAVSKATSEGGLKTTREAPPSDPNEPESRPAGDSEDSGMGLSFWTNVWVASEWLIRLIMLPVIVLRKEKPVTCLAWLTVVFFEPWVGLGLYLLIGENRLGRRQLARRQQLRPLLDASEYPRVEPAHVIDPAETDEYNVLTQLAEHGGGLPVVAGNSISLVSDTDEAIDRLIAEINSARHHVHLLFYIFKNDAVGYRVAKALVLAVARGVVCRVLADAVGSRQLFRGMAPWLQKHGVRVFPVLPANLWRIPFSRLDLRNHRKLAVIDGRVAFTGSQNLVEASYGHKRAGVWHDVMARVTGPVVRQLQGIFLEDWFYASGELMEDAALFPVCRPDGPIAIQVIPTGPDQPTELFQDLVVRAIFLARRRVVITSPYFIPDEPMLLALRLAALRGVQVDLVIPNRCDHRVVNAAGAFYCDYLMRFGVRVFLFQKGMLHAKTLTIDDELAMFGSANYDIRSFSLNFELNLFMHSAEAVEAMHGLQQGYLDQSLQAVPGKWPLQTLENRLKMNLAKLFSPLL